MVMFCSSWAYSCISNRTNDTLRDIKSVGEWSDRGTARSGVWKWNPKRATSAQNVDCKTYRTWSNERKSNERTPFVLGSSGYTMYPLVSAKRKSTTLNEYASPCSSASNRLASSSAAMTDWAMLISNKFKQFKLNLRLNLKICARPFVRPTVRVSARTDQCVRLCCACMCVRLSMPVLCLHVRVRPSVCAIQSHDRTRC